MWPLLLDPGIHPKRGELRRWRNGYLTSCPVMQSCLLHSHSALPQSLQDLLSTQSSALCYCIVTFLALLCCVVHLDPIVTTSLNHQDRLLSCPVALRPHCTTQPGPGTFHLSPPAPTSRCHWREFTCQASGVTWAPSDAWRAFSTSSPLGAVLTCDSAPARPCPPFLSNLEDGLTCLFSHRVEYGGKASGLFPTLTTCSYLTWRRRGCSSCHGLDLPLTDLAYPILSS